MWVLALQKRQMQSIFLPGLQQQHCTSFKLACHCHVFFNQSPGDNLLSLLSLIIDLQQECQNQTKQLKYFLHFTLPRYNLVLFFVLVHGNIYHKIMCVSQNNGKLHQIIPTCTNDIESHTTYNLYIFISCFTIGVLLSSLIFIRIFPILIDRQQSRNPFSIASPRNKRCMRC